jgi:Flp pilus assembly protein TadG
VSWVHHLRRLITDARGAMAVETAVVLALVLLPMFMVAIDGSRRIAMDQQMQRIAHDVMTRVAHEPGYATNAAALQGFVNQSLGLPQNATPVMTVTTSTWCACRADVVASGVTATRRTCGGNMCTNNSQPNRYAQLQFQRSFSPITPAGGVFGGTAVGTAHVRLPL